MASVFRKSATAMRLDSVAGGREYELCPRTVLAVPPVTLDAARERGAASVVAAIPMGR